MLEVEGPAGTLSSGMMQAMPCCCMLLRAQLLYGVHRRAALRLTHMQARTHVAAMAAAAASPPLRRLSVVETAVVAPSPSGPAPPECSLPLTFFDVSWLTSPPVERVFFYHLAADDDVAAILSGLKASLSRAVLAFYPLAGRLRLTPGTTTNRYELHYHPGDGVAFTVAECDDDVGGVDELATDEPREVARIAPLVPPLTGEAVLAVQATVMARGSGLAVGFAVNHAACDGTTSTRFLHTWAAAARGGGAADAPPPPPVIDRSLVQDPRGLYDFVLKAVQGAHEAQHAKMAGDQLIATFTLSKEDIQRAKDEVAGEAARRGVSPPPRCSSLVATFGFIWSCYQRAKDEASNGAADSPTYLIFPVDLRSRMKPPIPDGYLGNCISGAFCAAPKNQLATAGAGGLFTACAAVAAAIEGLGPADAMDELIERMKEAGASGAGMLTVAGSPRFRVYEVDLGFGRPAKVDIVSVAKTGAMAVAESRSGGGAGGIEVGISLPPGGMQRFQKCFADAIAWLHHPQPCS